MFAIKLCYDTLHNLYFTMSPNTQKSNRSARLLAATTLRNVLGTKNLGDILSERESIAHELHELLYEATEPWGVQVERVEVKTKTLFNIFFLILF